MTFEEHSKRCKAFAKEPINATGACRGGRKQLGILFDDYAHCRKWSSPRKCGLCGKKLFHTHWKDCYGTKTESDCPAHSSYVCGIEIPAVQDYGRFLCRECYLEELDGYWKAVLRPHPERTLEAFNAKLSEARSFLANLERV
jgi:hypothetical protein